MSGRTAQRREQPQALPCDFGDQVAGLRKVQLKVRLTHALAGIQRLREPAQIRLGRIVGGLRAGTGAAHRRAGRSLFLGDPRGCRADLLLFKNGKRFGVEFKRADAPVLTRSMMLALTDLKLDHLTVIYPGNRPYAFAERITVPPLGSPAGCMGRPRPDPCTLTWFRE